MGRIRMRGWGGDLGLVGVGVGGFILDFGVWIVCF